MELDKFLKLKSPMWAKFDKLLKVAEDSTESELGRKRLLEIVRHYRLVCSDLNQARTITANPQIIGRLNSLTARGYRFVYQNTQKKKKTTLKDLFLRDIPYAFRKEAVYMFIALSAFLLGGGLGLFGTLIDPHFARDVTPEQFYTEDVSERVSRIELQDERIDSIGKLANFSSQLYINNIRVSFLAFALGAFSIVGGVFYLFWTGTWFGAIMGTYILGGKAVFFSAWVGPHGALELPAIIFAGAAGIRMGIAFWLPKDLSRKTSMRRVFPNIWRILIGSSVILVIAGFIEGSFSQFSSKTVPYSVKISVAIVLFVSLVSFLFLRRKSKPEIL